MEYYIAFLIVGLGLGLSSSSIISSGSIKVQNAKDDLEAKKEWCRMISSQIKLGAKNDRRN
jgi:hypothetical protein